MIISNDNDNFIVINNLIVINDRYKNDVISNDS